MNEEEMQDVLSASRIGLWEIVYEKEQRPRFYGDVVMNDLLGEDDEMSPEQRYLFHRQHIHPVTGEMYVRCGGKRMRVRRM